MCADCPELVDELKRRIEALQAAPALLGNDVTTVPAGTASATVDYVVPGAGTASATVDYVVAGVRSGAASETVDHVVGGAPEGTASETVDQVVSGVRSAPGAPLAPPGYEILGELGRGGMGVVYKARQVKAKRTVALKMILAGGHAGAAELERFRLEGEAVARVQHPGIVQIHEVGDQEGRPFFSLEYVSGGSLNRKLQGTPLPANAAARLTVLLADAVHAAHEQGILHRDLKPANIFLQPVGQGGVTIEERDGAKQLYFPKVGDFGLAKSMIDNAAPPAESALSPPNSSLPSPHSPLTVTGALMGTPSYMAPG